MLMQPMHSEQYGMGKKVGNIADFTLFSFQATGFEETNRIN